MLEGLFYLYWIVSLLAGVAALGHTLSVLALARPAYLRELIFLQSAFIYTIFVTLLTELNRGQYSVYLDATRIGGMLGVSLLVITVPRFCNSVAALRLLGGIDKAFLAAGAILIIHFVVSAAVFFSSGHEEGAAYFDGHRVFPVMIAFLLLTLAQGYFIAAALVNKRPYPFSPAAYRVIRILAIVALAAIPALVAVDCLRWLFPALWEIHPQERFVILPGIHLLFGVAMILFVREEKKHLAPLSIDDRFDPTWGLSPREQEVAGLLAGGESYQSIADELFISVSTVQSHVKQIYRKIGVKNKMQLRDRLSGWKQAS